MSIIIKFNGYYNSTKERLINISMDIITINSNGYITTHFNGYIKINFNGYITINSNGYYYN